MASRAYGTEDKEARRRAILEAAAGLFIAGAGELPPVAEVARAAGLAKGTVYLYFRTKEAIFSALLQEGWGEVIAIVKEVFGQDGEAQERVETFLLRYVARIAADTDLLRLDALGHGVLMKNLEPAALTAFKTRLYGRVQEAGSVMDHRLQLPTGRGAQLLTRTYAMTRGIWQSFDETTSSGYAASAKYRSGFPGELSEALNEYWRGALGQAAGFLGGAALIVSV